MRGRPAPSCLGALLALLLVASCRGPRPADPVILALGEQVVRRSDFEKHVISLEASATAELGPEVRRALLESFLEQRVLVLEARARGLLGREATPEEEQRAVLRLLAEAAVSEVSVPQEGVEAYYRDHASEFALPETVSLRQILVPTLNEARDVSRQVRKEPRSFEVLARTVSRGPEAGEGGLMGTFARGQLPPELETAAFGVPVGVTSAIVSTSLGYHVLRVEERAPARTLSLAEAAARIKERLARQESERRVREFVTGLLARAKVNHAAAEKPSRSS